MAIPHKKFFDDVIRSIQSADASAVIAVVSQDGLVLSSNKEDSEIEGQLAALSSYALDTSGRLFAIPQPGKDNGPHDDTRTLLAVGDHRYVCVTRLIASALLVATGEDKTKIAAVMRKSLEWVDEIQNKIKQKELFL